MHLRNYMIPSPWEMVRFLMKRMKNQFSEFNFLRYGRFCTDIQKFFYVRGLRPQAPNGFGLNPTSQLVIGYHYLAFLNQVLKQSQVITSPVPNSLRMLNKKSTISQKLKIEIKIEVKITAPGFFAVGHFAVGQFAVRKRKNNRT